MDYDEVVEAFFRPSPPGVVPAPVAAASPARRLRDAIEPIAMHSVWSRPTNERLHDLGLDFLGGYVWGRAAALGEPDAGVVVSSFAVFEPGMLTATYDQARGDVPTGRAARRAHARRRSRASTPRSPVPTSPRSPTGSPRRWRRPTPPVARCSPGWRGRRGRTTRSAGLWRACELAREHRGDSHVAACIVDGWAPIAMNVLTELWVGMPLGSYSATRGWSPEQIAATAAALRAGRTARRRRAVGRRPRRARRAGGHHRRHGAVDRRRPRRRADAGDRPARRVVGGCVAAGAFPPTPSSAPPDDRWRPPP